MIRLIQIALLLAIIIPFGMAVRWGVEGLPEAARWFGAGVPVGIAIMIGLNAWDRRTERRR